MKNPIDAFVLAKLEEKGLAPSKPADRRTLIRRVSFDLIGLPPTPEEVEAFLNDPSPDAYEKVVDRLLASPHYGERWGRDWLDLARYSDTKGYVFTEERRYPYSIPTAITSSALHDDLPYDQFIRAAVRGGSAAARRRQAAAGGAGLPDARPTFPQQPVGHHRRPHRRDHARLPGAEVGSAAATTTSSIHPQKDYYSLYGVFASSSSRRSFRSSARRPTRRNPPPLTRN